MILYPQERDYSAHYILQRRLSRRVPRVRPPLLPGDCLVSTRVATSGTRNVCQVQPELTRII